MIVESTKEVHIDKVVELLNQALQVQYSMIIHYPQISKSVSDGDISRYTLMLFDDSTKHANTIVDIINQLGGKVQWSFEDLPKNMDMKELFEMQLKREEQVLRLYQQSASLIPEDNLKWQLNYLVKGKTRQIRIIQRIISMLQNSILN